MDPPDLQPTLIGPHVILRPVVPADWDEMFAAASDPQIWAVHPVHDRYTEPVFRTFFDSALASGSAFSIVDRASGGIIGSSRYHDYDAAKHEIEIGFTFLSRAWWGGSTNREVKDLMLAHAFTFADTVVFWVGETNWRSQRAMEKIGGIRRSGNAVRVMDGKAYSHVVFEITREGFERREASPA